MKTFYLYLFFLILSTNATSQIYASKYKWYIDKTINASNQINNLPSYFVKDKQILIVSSKDGCYVDVFSKLEQPKISKEMGKMESVYINYNNSFCKRQLDSDTIFKYELKKFRREPTEEKRGKYKVQKYISYDGKIRVYATTDLPWHIQPAIINFNQFGEGIIKIVHLKTGLVIELTSNEEVMFYKKENLYKNQIMEIISKFKSLTDCKIIPNPIF